MEGIEFEEDKDYKELKIKTSAPPPKEPSAITSLLEKSWGS